MKPVTTVWAAVAIAATFAASTACNRTEPEREAVATADRAATQPRSDYSITTSVQAKYFGNPDVRSQAIDVSTNSGVVTLRGTVHTDAARQQAVSLAHSVEGVKQVDDQLTVAPATAQAQDPAGQPTAGEKPTGTAGEAARTVDAGWITTKIHSQYFLNPTVKTWNVDVTTNSNGVVSLSGQVGSQEAKTEAVRIAREVEGVSRVEDHLRIEGQAAGDTAESDPDFGPNQPDPWITAKIQSKYFLDDEVKGHEINVDTNNGVVTLNGTVANEARRRQAVSLARATDGVKSVTDNLQVRSDTTANPAAGAARPVRTLEQAASDGWITTKIQSQYFLDGDVKGHKIDVDTRNGVVTLNGQVATDALKKQAEQIARETDGVKKVDNRLKVGAA
jgi:osmotically-inducible protein OsmY